MATKKSTDSPVEEAGFKLLGAHVELEVEGRMYGSVPKSDKLIRNWVESQGGPIPEESLEDKLAAVGTRAPDAPEVEAADDAEKEVEERVSCGFRLLPISLDGAPPSEETKAVCLRDFMVKAMIGSAAQTMGITKKVRGTRTVLREGFQIRPQAIPFLRDGRPLDRPDGYEDFVGHVMTPQGRRSILKRCDFVENVTFKFNMVWVPTRGTNAEYLVTVAKLDELLRFAGAFSGIGSQRHFEAGKFRVRSVEGYEPQLSEL